MTPFVLMQIASTPSQNHEIMPLVSVHIAAVSRQASYRAMSTIRLLLLSRLLDTLVSRIHRTLATRLLRKLLARFLICGHQLATDLQRSSCQLPSSVEMVRARSERNVGVPTNQPAASPCTRYPPRPSRLYRPSWASCCGWGLCPLIQTSCQPESSKPHYSRLREGAEG